MLDTNLGLSMQDWTALGIASDGNCGNNTARSIILSTAWCSSQCGIRFKL